MTKEHRKAMQAAQGEVVSMIADGYRRMFESNHQRGLYCVSLRHTRNGARVRVVVVENMLQVFVNGVLRKTQWF